MRAWGPQGQNRYAPGGHGARLRTDPRSAGLRDRPMTGGETRKTGRRRRQEKSPQFDIS